MFVFDDIRWSLGMERAWNRLKTDPRLPIVVDLCGLGIAIGTRAPFHGSFGDPNPRSLALPAALRFPPAMLLARMSASDSHEVEVVIEGHARPVGGIEVTRVLPSLARRNVGPFVFLDHMGPMSLPSGRGFDVPPHPHIGLSTVTYLLEGEIGHRDSLGSVQSIEPSAVNLMVAGRGIVHSERSSPEARRVASPCTGCSSGSRCRSTRKTLLPRSIITRPRRCRRGARTTSQYGSYWARSAHGDPRRPIRRIPGSWISPCRRGPPSPYRLAWKSARYYVVDGSLAVGVSAFGRHRLIVRARGATLSVTALLPTRSVVLGGPPLDARRYVDWNFVSSSPERIERAKDDWRAQ